jgi:hypothetical protein
MGQDVEFAANGGTASGYLAEPEGDGDEFYEGAGHAFFNDTDRLGTHHEGHAKRAWERTVDFFKSHLGRE